MGCNGIARIKIEKGDEYHPTIMKLQFTPEVWNFAFHQGRMERWLGSEEELQRLEARHAVEKCTNMIQRELMRAMDEQLGIKW